MCQMSVIENPKRDAILVAATTLFGRYGYRRTSLEDISKETGDSRPSLFTKWRGRLSYSGLMLVLGLGPFDQEHAKGRGEL